jgi:hypothetical protein
MSEKLGKIIWLFQLSEYLMKAREQTKHGVDSNMLSQVVK